MDKSVTPEQHARKILENLGIDEVFTCGDLIELANLIADCDKKQKEIDALSAQVEILKAGLDDYWITTEEGKAALAMTPSEALYKRINEEVAKELQRLHDVTEIIGGASSSYLREWIKNIK